MGCRVIELGCRNIETHNKWCHRPIYQGEASARTTRTTWAFWSKVEIEHPITLQGFFDRDIRISSVSFQSSASFWNKEKYTIFDAARNYEPWDYAQALIRAANTAELGGVPEQMALIWNDSNLGFQSWLPPPHWPGLFYIEIDQSRWLTLRLGVFHFNSLALSNVCCLSWWGLSQSRCEYSVSLIDLMTQR